MTRAAMTDKRDRRGLGRGLSALIGDAETARPTPLAEVPPPAPAEDPAPRPATEHTLPVDLIAANPDQPRRRFRPEDLEELTASIKAHGIIQPLIVRPDPTAEGRYQIVAGERRWRAAQAAQLHEVPVIIRALEDREVLELALIENVQRADLSPVEEARGYAQLIEQFAYTQEALARVLGKSRSHLANTLRLLSLPEHVLNLVEAGSLSAGHARAMITAQDPVALARETVARGLTVRQVEARAKQMAKDPKGAAPQPLRTGTDKDADTRLLEGDLAAALGLRVQISHSGSNGAGEVRISYRSLDDLDRLCQRMTG